MQCLIIFLFLISCVSLSVHARVTCYQCRGYDCLPRETSTRRCRKKATNTCYYISVNNTELIRGCYEDGDPHKWICEDHYYNSCILCNSSLCNDYPVYNPNLIPCHFCNPAQSRCRNTDLLAFNVKLCRPSLYPDRPACYSLYDHEILEYEFGCLSELGEEKRAICDNDWFDLTCQVCYSPRCNNELFYDESYELHCHGFNNKIIKCPWRKVNRPYYGCYIDKKEEMGIKGCVSDRYAYDGYMEWMDLMRVPKRPSNGDHYICTTNRCNEGGFESEYWIE